MSFCIDDGNNLHGKIPGRTGGLGELTFDYRVAMPLRVAKHGQATTAPKVSPDSVIHEHAKLVCEHLTAWNVTTKTQSGAGDAFESPLEITIENIKRLPWPQLMSLVDHVQGYGGKLEPESEGNG